jgi:Raf kinase inhibitor-like YbhB/YbcL family protein
MNKSSARSQIRQSTGQWNRFARGRTGFLLLAPVLAIALAAGCRRSGPAVERDGPDSLALTSPDLKGGRFPGAFTCDGANISPELHWNTPPTGTQSQALILFDRSIGAFVHWVIYDLPPQTTALPQAVPESDQLPNNTQQGRNDFDKIGYGGPCPPGHSEHRYVFTLFALDTKLNLPAGATRAQLDDAMKGHVLARGVYTAAFSH